MGKVIQLFKRPKLSGIGSSLLLFLKRPKYEEIRYQFQDWKDGKWVTREMTPLPYFQMKQFGQKEGELRNWKQVGNYFYNANYSQVARYIFVDMKIESVQHKKCSNCHCGVVSTNGSNK